MRNLALDGAGVRAGETMQRVLTTRPDAHESADGLTRSRLGGLRRTTARGATGMIVKAAASAGGLGASTTVGQPD